MHTYSLLVREFHLDTFGHMNNATYLQIFEEARWELITSNGYDLKKIQQVGLGPVILDVHLKFLKEVTLRELITIKTELIDYKGKIGHLRQVMEKADGTVAAEATFTFGLFDLKARKLVEPTQDWERAVGVLT